MSASSPKAQADAAVAAAAAAGPWAGSMWTASQVPMPRSGMHPFHRWRALLYSSINDGSTLAGRVVISLLTVGILLSVIVFCLQTLPQYRLAALQGQEPDDARVFDVIEAVVMISFTVDYAARLLTVTAVPTLSEQRRYAILAAQGKTAPLCDGCSLTCRPRRRSRRASAALSETGGGSVRGGDASTPGADDDYYDDNADGGKATPGAPPVLPLSVRDAARSPVLSAGGRGQPPPQVATPVATTQPPPLLPPAVARDVTDAPPAPAAARDGGEIEMTDLRPAGVPLPARVGGSGGSPPPSGGRKVVTIVDADGSVHGTDELLRGDGSLGVGQRASRRGSRSPSPSLRRSRSNSRTGGDAGSATASPPAALSEGSGGGSRPWVDTSASASTAEASPPATIAHRSHGGSPRSAAAQQQQSHDSQHHPHYHPGGGGGMHIRHADSAGDDSPSLFLSPSHGGTPASSPLLLAPASAARSSSLTRLIAAVEAAGARGELPPLPPPPPPYFADLEGYYASALAVGLAQHHHQQFGGGDGGASPGGGGMGRDGLPLSVSVAAARMAALSTTTGRLAAAGHDYVASISSRADVVDCCCDCPLPPSAPLPLRKLFSFVTSPLNVIDIIAITPFYVSLSDSARNSVALQVVRVLRIGRVLTLLKLTRHHSGLMVLSATMRASTHMLLFLLFFVTLAVVFYGALMFYCEAGEYDALTGEWMRINQLHDGLEPTPFTSIPVSMYWAVVTLTTVGEWQSEEGHSRAVPGVRGAGASIAGPHAFLTFPARPTHAALTPTARPPTARNACRLRRHVPHHRLGPLPGVLRHAHGRAGAGAARHGAERQLPGAVRRVQQAPQRAPPPGGDVEAAGQGARRGGQAGARGGGGQGGACGGARGAARAPLVAVALAVGSAPAGRAAPAQPPQRRQRRRRRRRRRRRAVARHRVARAVAVEQAAQLQGDGADVACQQHLRR
jgi:hypothetical protein